MINDTDHDGIDNGAEFKYWQDYIYDLWGGWVNKQTGAKVNDTAVEYLKNPDVDKDNVANGKEIKGWTVKISAVISAIAGNIVAFIISSIGAFLGGIALALALIGGE